MMTTWRQIITMPTTEATNMMMMDMNTMPITVAETLAHSSKEDAKEAKGEEKEVEKGKAKAETPFDKDSSNVTVLDAGTKCESIRENHMVAFAQSVWVGMFVKARRSTQITKGSW